MHEAIPVIDYSWQNGRIYRGYRWSIYLTSARHPWQIAGRGLRNERSYHLAITFRSPPKFSWSGAHSYRQRSETGVQSFDYVPWEIHEIEDELAYHHALASYLVSIDRPPLAETYDQIIDSLKIWL